MLSYQHGYHAGNHADVLKHTVLVALLDHMTRKPKPVSFVDTHAGAGAYALHGKEASKHREYETGIARLWDRDDLPSPLARYSAVVRACNEGRRLRSYPGSPRIALELLRPEDPMDLYELHPTEAGRLERLCRGRSRLRVRREDGLKGLVGLLPPPSRRGLVLIDPSYEVKAEFAAVVKALKDAHRRFATGTYAIWYPVTSRERVETLARKVRNLGIPDVRRFELCVGPDTADFGMTGSGMIVANPAFTLADAMTEALPWLAEVLGGPGASWVNEVLVEE